MAELKDRGAPSRNYRQVWLAVAVLIFSASGTLLTWRYLPPEQFSLFVLLSGLIFSFLLSGILYLLATSSDLRRLSNELSRAKDTAEGERARYEALLANIGDGVIAVDALGTINFMNNAAESLLDLAPGEGLKKPWHAILHRITDDGIIAPAESGAIYAALHTMRKTSTAMQYAYVRKSGASLPVAVTVSPVILRGTIIGAIEVFRDVTREREVDKAKTEFVSLASHQLRAPLTTINWYAELLLSGDAGKLTTQQRSHLREIYEASKRMTELVRALLNVSRIDMGTFAIEPESTSVVDILKDVIKEFIPYSTTHHVSLKGKYERGIPLIVADPKLLRIVFQNLISNATKYTKDGGSVSVAAGVKGDVLEVVVVDNGYGIPRHQQPKIFTKLFRAENAREKIVDGTGLGLYVAKAIVEQSGGRIWFQSEENKGTTFYVTLPLRGMQRKEGTKGITYTG